MCSKETGLQVAETCKPRTTVRMRSPKVQEKEGSGKSCFNQLFSIIISYLQRYGTGQSQMAKILPKGVSCD